MNKLTFWVILIIIVLVAAGLFVYLSKGIFRAYKTEAVKLLEQTATTKPEILTKEDIQSLPQPVQNYIQYTGALGKEKVYNMHVTFEGEMKPALDKPWSKINTQQYNSFVQHERLYHINGNFSGISAIGTDSYINGHGRMIIKLMGIFKVVDDSTKEMDQSAMVTQFNDMCLLAPATLIDKRIRWESIDDLSVKATFSDMGKEISATLYFNDKGELLKFVTDDRYMSQKNNNNINVRWSTPVKEYKDYGGIRLASYGEAVWHLPEGDYCYAKARPLKVEYNCNNFIEE